ncbi:MAG: hypothetical protein QM771_12300 [Nitrospira sp.]
MDGAFYAIDNTCVHRGGPLGEGDVVGGRGRLPLAQLGVQREDRRLHQ